MKNPKTIAITVGVIVLIGIGFFFVRGPKPVIQIKAEHPLFANSVFPLANTYTSSVLTVVVVLIIGYLGGRKANLIPHAVQNLVEAVLEAVKKSVTIGEVSDVFRQVWGEHRDPAYL